MKYAITALSGLVVGFIAGVLIVILLFAGLSRSSKPVPSGTQIKLPEGAEKEMDAAVVVLNENFFKSVLKAIFNDMNAPSFPLQAANSKPSENDSTTAMSFALQQNNSCDGKVYLLPSGSSVTTQVYFVDGKVTAPLAFKGSYNLLGSCVEFTGWADAKIELRFDESKQTVFGQLEVVNINLDGALAIAGSVLQPMIQETINSHVNPVELLNAKQLALSVPIKNAKGTLKANVKDVRAEAKDGQLRLSIKYDFKGEKD